MRPVATLVRRNLRVFWRDRLTVFFSLLSPLILFLLFLVFYRRQIANLILDAIPGATSADAYALCDEWLFASVTALATFSSSAGLLTGFVEDRAAGRFSDYLVSPVRRSHLAAGYVISSLIVSVVLSSLIVVLGETWALVKVQPLMTVSQDARIVLGVVMASLVFSTFNTLIVTFTATPGSFGGYFIVMATAMGFLSFCYVPPVSLPDNITAFLSSLPFAQAASLLRSPAMEPAIANLVSGLPAGPVRDDARSTIAHNLGMHLSVHSYDLTAPVMIGLLLCLTALFAVLGARRLGRVIR